MGHKGVELIKIEAFYLLPYSWKVGRIFSVLWLYAMTLHVPVTIQVVLWTHKPGFSFLNSAILYHTNSNFTNRCAFACGCLKVYCDEIQSFFHSQSSPKKSSRLNSSSS